MNEENRMQDEKKRQIRKMRKSALIIAILALLVIAGCGSSSKTAIKETITIYKTQSCGCCKLYTGALAKYGFDVNVVTVADISKIKQQFKIPSNLESCHTSVIGNYFVEGHIPGEAIEKLWQEKPDIAGIALPGMPSGSPGMPGAKTDPFVISAVKNDGSSEEFMQI